MQQWEIEKINEINERKKMNFQVFAFIASFLNNCPDLISREMMLDMTGGDSDFESRAYSIFLSNAFSEEDDVCLRIEKEYLKTGIKKLYPEEYLENPFFKNIRIPERQEGNWQLDYQSYKPYEGFIYKDIEVGEDYLEVPCVGFFDKEFSYPTVFENGVEWMAIKPNEIETMKETIKKARGRVLVYGLGIGYFTYMASMKDEVECVTVVERDENAIKLFNEYILPQFPRKDKITIVKSDAFEYAQREMKKGNFDYCFTDLWHDVSDGVELYAKMKKYEATCPKTTFEYWIEKSILSSIRWRIFDAIYEKVQKGSFEGTYDEVKSYLTDGYLRELVKFI
ncbi:MAG: hypothetical protein J6B34_02950 [Clostridia bacterium]|nr:hypothetical protein [Clostridia bacterium]